jgi:hypothetical protein
MVSASSAADTDTNNGELVSVESLYELEEEFRSAILRFGLLDCQLQKLDQGESLK